MQWMDQIGVRKLAGLEKGLNAIGLVLKDLDVMMDVSMMESIEKCVV